MANIDVNTPSEDEQSTAQAVTPTAEPTTSAPAPVEPVETTAAPAAEEVKPAQPVAAVQPKPARAKPSTKTLVHYAVDAVLVVLVIALAVSYMGVKSQKADVEKELAAVKANPQSLVQKQTTDLIAKVGALMTLPSDEQPTVAEVSDAETAKKQSAFFVNAANGDKVLMYAKAGTAILYRPSTDKIILVAPLTFNK